MEVFSARPTVETRRRFDNAGFLFRGFFLVDFEDRLFLFSSGEALGPSISFLRRFFFFETSVGICLFFFCFFREIFSARPTVGTRRRFDNAGFIVRGFFLVDFEDFIYFSFLSIASAGNWFFFVRVVEKIQSEAIFFLCPQFIFQQVPKNVERFLFFFFYVFLSFSFFFFVRRTKRPGSRRIEFRRGENHITGTATHTHTHKIKDNLTEFYLVSTTLFGIG